MGDTSRASVTTPSGPVRAVHGISLGEVQVRPKNIEGTGTPMLWWTLTARTWSPWLPVLAFVIEHERGTVLFDTGQSPDSLTDKDYYPGGMLGWVYRRQARFRITDEQTLPASWPRSVSLRATSRTWPSRTCTKTTPATSRRSPRCPSTWRPPSSPC